MEDMFLGVLGTDSKIHVLVGSRLYGINIVSLISRDEVRILANSVYKGGSQSGVLCPFCRGGKGAEKSMSITHRPDGVKLYICHRASCKAAGRIDGSGVSVNENVLKAPEPRRFEGQTRNITEEEVGTYLSKYGLTIGEVKRFGLRFTEIERRAPRLVVPLHGKGYEFLGHETRRLVDDGLIPKTLHYRENFTQPWIGWFWKSGLDYTWDKVLLVEDPISAMRASGVLPTGSLMGSHITLEEILDLLKVTDNIVLALDRDATEKAYELQKKYSFVAPGLKVMPLERDLKYETEEKIRDLLGNYG